MLIKAVARDHPTASHEQDDPAPRFDDMPPIPLDWAWIGGHPVYRCSSPIIRVLSADEEYSVQAFPRDRIELLRESAQGVIRVGQGDQKSYRLKHDQLLVSEIVWFAVTRNRPSKIRQYLHRINHLGSQSKRGRGRVVEWIVEPVESDYSWFAQHPDGIVLMRNLPECDELPEGLRGCLSEYNAVTPPYFHPERKISAVVPC